MNQYTVWQAKKKQLETIGLPLQKNKALNASMLELVASLQTIGLTVTAAYDGHDDHPRAPFVHFQLPTSNADKEKYKNLRFKYGVDSAEARIFLRDLERRRMKEKSKLLPYLDIFYEAQNDKHSERLVIEDRGLVSAVLCLQDADEHTLKWRQEKVSRFASFMRQKIMEPMKTNDASNGSVSTTETSH